MANSQISLKDIYDAVGKLEEKIDHKIDGLEERTRGLESFKDKFSIYITLGNVVLTGVMTWIYKRFLPE